MVLNVGGMVDTTWFQKDSRISAALMAWQAGMEGGLAEADILCGDVNPPESWQIPLLLRCMIIRQRRIFMNLRLT